MADDKDLMAERYERRKSDENIRKHNSNLYFNHYAVCERELKYAEIIRSRFPDISKLTMLEIGAGNGSNLLFFKRLGFAWNNIYANELLTDRFNELKENFPMINSFSGDASELDMKGKEGFDIVFQSTVFTSILDPQFRKKLADNIWTMVKPGGIVLWYDFVYDNPKNKDVKGISRADIRSLFPASSKISFSSVTLAPPIGRRVNKLYPLFNMFPFLRTHVVAEIVK